LVPFFENQILSQLSSINLFQVSIHILLFLHVYPFFGQVHLIFVNFTQVKIFRPLTILLSIKSVEKGMLLELEKRVLP
jgi:hypothetical protein